MSATSSTSRSPTRPPRRPRRPPPTTGSTPNWSDDRVTEPGQASQVSVPEVLALLDSAAAADGVRPLSEDAELRLQHGAPGGHDVLVRDGDALVGYARVDDG